VYHHTQRLTRVMRQHMVNPKFVSYLRVSTDRQGASGLGLEAQRKAVLDYLNGGRWTLVAEFIETESGAKTDRPKLADALALARAHGAKLVIAKLDRLSRDAHFLLGLQNAGVQFVAADMPEANEMIVGIMAVVAQAERKMISKRSKDALAAAKARGQKLGGFRGYVPTVEDRAAAGKARSLKAVGHASSLAPILSRIDPEGRLSLRAIAAALSAEGLPTPAGGAVWTASTVQRVKAKLAA
jgi:DNA invertase Pin-like site-specific DNA recombinase